MEEIMHISLLMILLGQIHSAPLSPLTMPVPTTNLPLTTIPEPASTTVEPTRALGCYHNGKIYPYGSEISRGYDKSADWCYGNTCSMDGYVIAWDKPNCKHTTVPPTTTLPPTEPPTTIPPPTEPPTTTPPTTEPPTTTLHTITGDHKDACCLDGQCYPLGTEMNEGYDRSSNWCYGSYCDYNGQIIMWDTWNCHTTTPPPTTPPTMPPTTTPPTTTLEPTTISTTTPPGCYYDSKFYAPGEKINEGYDASSNWCYGMFCSQDAQLQYWDNFMCHTTTMTPTTTMPPPDEDEDELSTTSELVSSTESVDSTKEKKPTGCLHKGAIYSLGQTIERDCEGKQGCKVLLCTKSGSIDTLDDITRVHPNLKKGKNEKKRKGTKGKGKGKNKKKAEKGKKGKKLDKGKKWKKLKGEKKGNKHAKRSTENKLIEDN